MKIDLTLDRRRAALALVTVAVSLGLTTLLVAVLQERVGVPNASAVYLLAVVVVAVGFGTIAATAAAIGGFLLYDLLFTQPLHTFAVADPDEWLNLILLLLIGIVVGQLAAAQRNRAESAEAREREARVLFQVSRALATRSETTVALAEIVDTLRQQTQMSRVRVVLGSDAAAERVSADTNETSSFGRPSSYSILKRMPAEEPAHWVRVRDRTPAGSRSLPEAASRSAAGGGAVSQPTSRAAVALDGAVAEATSPSAGASGGTAPDAGGQGGLTDAAFRVNIEASGRTIGAVWALRPRLARAPSREETRMLAAAADQIGQAVEQDRLRGEAASAELARRSDALKTALLESVSHDLRTPLASIRATAGSLMDPEVRWSEDERRQSAGTIDLEAERLNRLVTNLLDMSRIEAGGLRADTEPYALDDLVRTSLRRLTPRSGGRVIKVDVPPDLPPVKVDPTFIDQVLANVLENAIKYSPDDAVIRITANATSDAGFAQLVIEDAGSGVPAEALPRLFDKFYRVSRPGEGARRGTGMGLAVARGLVETMGGRIEARPSPLGGLAIVIDLPEAAPRPSESPVAAQTGGAA
jgi:two-component system sensor histidine kinase KdpD